MATSCDADAILRVFTACPNDIHTFILDVRNQKHYKRLHINQAYNIRLSANGQALLDYSQATFDVKWSNGIWWGKNVIVYGDADLKKDHPVVDYLVKEKRCKSLMYFKDGFEALEKATPFLCTPSVKANSIKKYPSQIVPGLLYLGDWSHAQAQERLDEINVRRIITIHNHPENLKPPSRVMHLKFELPDVDNADVSQYFNRTYECIEEARHKGHAVLVHCGAGVSRSATLCIMYLMRANLWSAQKAKDHCVERRSLVCPNDGFWRALCALEAELGIADRSDPNATSGFHGDDAPPAQLSADAAGEKVQIVMELAGDERGVKRPAEEQGGRDAKQHKGSGGAVKQEAQEEAQPSSSKPGVTLVFSVLKPEGKVGTLTVGPMRFHQRVCLGRAPTCDVVLEHASISRQHAQLTVDVSGAAFVTDLQSGHGTKLDDVWIRPHAQKVLKVGSVLQFGASTRQYKVVSIGSGPRS